MIPVLLSLAFMGGLAVPAPSEPVTAYRNFEQAVEAFRAGDFPKAVSLAESLIEHTPDKPDLWYVLSLSYERIGKLPQAITAAERVLELGYARRARISYRVARMYAQISNREAALDWLSRALEARYEDRPEIQHDVAFSAFRDHPQFMKLAGILPAGDLTRTQGLQFDLDYLVEEARRMHAGLSRPAFSLLFEAEASALRKSIPEMSDAQVMAALTKLIAILNDGHSAIYGVGPDSPLHVSTNRLPLKFYLFPEGLFIIDGSGEFSAHAGSKVLSFGQLTTEEVLERLLMGRGLDNAMTWSWMGPQFYIGSMARLHSVGAAESTESVQLTLENIKGEKSSVTIAGGDFENIRKLRPSPAANGPIPTYLLNIDKNYWLKPLPENAALYFQFNKVRDMKDESLASFSSRLHERLSTGEVRHLIIDVRHNNGGNNGLLRPLIRTLVAFEMASAENRIYVITGRNTFSAAQNFINRVEAWTDAVFVGEPSSSSPNFVGEETNLLLPYSRIRGSISTRYWQDSSPGDERAWISPDIPVVLSFKDYFANRDPAMEALLEMIPRRPE
jgi:hypothetical protein